jgi:hypothetical protein
MPGRNFDTTNLSPPSESVPQIGPTAASVAGMTMSDMPAQRLTASQRLDLAMGRPVQDPPTEAEIREILARLDCEDAEIRRFYADDARSTEA